MCHLQHNIIIMDANYYAQVLGLFHEITARNPIEEILWSSLFYEKTACWRGEEVTCPASHHWIVMKLGLQCILLVLETVVLPDPLH